MEYQLALSGETLVDFDAAPFAAVGLLRGEYICRAHGSYLGTEVWRQAFHDYLGQILKVFPGRPVWYRAAELEVAEINVLDGADVIIERDPNPALGMRGARRACRYPEAFRAELTELTELASRHPQLHLIVPFLSDPEELVILKREIELAGFPNRIGMMAEIPSAILCLEDFLVLGVDHVLVGMNDLSSLVMGADRSSGLIRSTHPAIMRMLRMAREATAKHNVSLAVAGYFDQALVDACRAMSFDAAVMHYSLLNRFDDFREVRTPEAGNLLAVKEKTRAAIRARERQKWAGLLAKPVP